MKSNTYKIFHLAFALSITSISFAQQQVISSAGQQSVSSNNSQLTWTLGQTISSSASSGNSIYLGAGFQTSEKTVSVVSGFSNQKQQIYIYPNPTVDHISISPSTGPYKGDLQLINTLGRIILEQHDVDFSEAHVIDMYNYTNGAYVLRINIDDESPRRYKIIKQ